MAAALLTCLCGCPPRTTNNIVLEPVPMADLITKVNANHAKVTATLKAVGGHARGVFTDTDGSKRRFDLDAALLVRPPRDLRLDLKALLESQLVFGSNATKYWVEQPGAHALSYGRHDTMLVPNAGDLIIRPDLFVEALGLTPLPSETAGDGGPFQRITKPYQELLFIDYQENGQGYIAKEYWVSRREPQLVARIVFRDTLGRIALESEISDYRRLGDDGPYLPHRVRLSAPVTGSWLEFTAWGWKLMPNVGPDHPAFTFPLDRGAQFERIVDLDVELDQMHHPFTEEEQLQQLLTPPQNQPEP